MAKKLAEEVGGIVVSVDDIREILCEENELYKKWVNFYSDQDEYTYYTTTTREKQWENIKRQSEELWPGILEHCKQYEHETKPIIFEGVNIFPHLAYKDFDFPGVILLGSSFEETFKRNKESPRWGETEELQKMESEWFFYGERPRYKEEGEKHGYPVFEKVEDAFSTGLDLLRL